MNSLSVLLSFLRFEKQLTHLFLGRTGSHDNRRYSISSASSNEMEDSLASLHPNNAGATTTIGRIANKLRPSFMRDSVYSEDLEGVSIWMAQTNYAYDTRLLFKRRIRTLWISMSNLKSYVEVNYSGLRKILKKYVSFHFPQLHSLMLLLGTTK